MRIGALLVAAYYSVLISYFYVVIARAEQGSLEVPEFADFPGITPGMLWPIVQFAIVVFMPAAPVLLILAVAVASGGAHLRALSAALDPLLVVAIGAFVLCGALLVPMALIVLAISRSLLQALNPVLLVRQIVKIPKDYALATAATAIVVCVGALWMLLLVLTIGSLEQPGVFLVVGLVMYLLDGAVQLYVFMVLGHLLGYLAHQTRVRLNWWSELPGELMVRGKPVQLRKEEW